MGRKQREETHRGPGKEQNVPAMLTIPGATSTGPSRTPLALNSFASRTCTVRTGIQAHVQQNLGLHRHSTWDKAQPNPWAQEIARSLNRFRQHLQTAGNVHRGLRRSSCTVLVAHMASGLVLPAPPAPLRSPTAHLAGCHTAVSPGLLLTPWHQHCPGSGEQKRPRSLCPALTPRLADLSPQGRSVSDQNTLRVIRSPNTYFLSA